MITKAKRFNDGQKQANSPGPAAYEQGVFKSIAWSLQKKDRLKGAFNRAKRYIDGYKKSIQPGPASYTQCASHLIKPLTIPKASRNLKLKYAKTPGPGEYNAPELAKYKLPQSTRQSFAKSKREVPTKRRNFPHVTNK